MKTSLLLFGATALWMHSSASAASLEGVSVTVGLSSDATKQFLTEASAN